MQDQKVRQLYLHMQCNRALLEALRIGLLKSTRWEAFCSYKVYNDIFSVYSIGKDPAHQQDRGMEMTDCTVVTSVLSTVRLGERASASRCVDQLRLTHHHLTRMQFDWPAIEVDDQYPLHHDERFVRLRTHMPDEKR